MTANEPNQGECLICGQTFEEGTSNLLLPHLRDEHPDEWGDGPMTWPDGEIVIVDQTLTPRDFDGDPVTANEAHVRAVAEALELACNDGCLDSEHTRDAEVAVATLTTHDECPHEDQDACDAWETTDGLIVCGPSLGSVCDECRNEDGDRYVDWPCATIRALGDELGEAGDV